MSDPVPPSHGERSLDDITEAIVDAAYRIHFGLGPGLLESLYRTLLARELERRSLSVEVEKEIQLVIDGVVFDRAFRADLIVERRVLIEVKSVEMLAAVHARQVLTYLKLTNMRVGFLINFGAARLKEGLRRFVNDLEPSASPRLRVNRPDSDVQVVLAFGAVHGLWQLLSRGEHGVTARARKNNTRKERQSCSCFFPRTRSSFRELRATAARSARIGPEHWSTHCVRGRGGNMWDAVVVSMNSTPSNSSGMSASRSNP